MSRNAHETRAYKLTRDFYSRLARIYPGGAGGLGPFLGTLRAIRTEQQCSYRDGVARLARMIRKAQRGT